MTKTDWIDCLYLFALTGGPVILVIAAAYAVYRWRLRGARPFPTERHPHR